MLFSLARLLGRGSMFVISAGQLRRLFNLSDDFRADSLLDLGAGDGATTSLIAPVSPTRRTFVSGYGHVTSLVQSSECVQSTELRCKMFNSQIISCENNNHFFFSSLRVDVAASLLMD